MGQSAAKDRIGKTFNSIKILSISHKEKGRTWYEVECLNCKGISTMRTDRFDGRHKLSTCSLCRQDEAKKKSSKRSSEETLYNSQYSSYMGNAINRNLSFEISKTEFKVLVLQNCYYCGKSPETKKRTIRGKTRIFIANGIDRVDNNQDYEKGNVVPCCTKCNMMKKDLTHNEFLEHINRIYDQRSTTSQKA